MRIMHRNSKHDPAIYFSNLNRHLTHAFSMADSYNFTVIGYKYVA